MTTPVIASLVPGGVGLPEQRRTTRSRTVRSRRPLPLTEVPTRRTATTVYGVAALDCHGRIADRVVLRALGWPPGTRLEMRGNREQIIVRACADGRSSVTPEDHVRLPATLRHRHGLESGGRVLVVAEPATATLRVIPPATLDRLLSDVEDPGKSLTDSGPSADTERRGGRP